MNRSAAYRPLVDLSKFPDNWVPSSVFVPTIERASMIGKIRRQLVVTAFPPNRYPELGWLFMNVHEHWVAAVSRWAKNVGAAGYKFRNSNEVIASRLAAMVKCRAPGYHGDSRRGKIATRCDNRLCPFCHARRGVDVFDRLVAAYRSVPHQDPIYIGLVSYNRKNGVTNLEKELRRRKVAAASGMKYPIAVDRNTGEIVQSFKALVLADDKESVRGLHHFRVTGVGGIALAVARWFTYPAIWSSPTPRRPDPLFMHALRIAAAMPNPTKIVLHFGACRADHDSTKSAMGFKLSPLQTEFLLNRKGPQCPRRSPPPGSSATPCSTSPSPPEPSDPAPKTPPPPS